MCYCASHSAVDNTALWEAHQRTSLDAIKILRSTGQIKKVITDRVEKSPDAPNLLAACGRDIPACSETLSDLEQFVIHFVYSDANSKT